MSSSSRNSENERDWVEFSIAIRITTLGHSHSVSARQGQATPLLRARALNVRLIFCVRVRHMPDAARGTALTHQRSIVLFIVRLDHDHAWYAQVQRCVLARN